MSAEQPHFIPPQQTEGARLPEEAPLRVWGTLTRRAILATNKAEGYISDFAYQRALMTLHRQEAQEEERTPATPRDNAILELYNFTTMVHVATPFLGDLIAVDGSFRDLTLDQLQQFRTRYERKSDEEIHAESRRIEAEHEQKVNQMFESSRRNRIKNTP